MESRLGMILSIIIQSLNLKHDQKRTYKKIHPIVLHVHYPCNPKTRSKAGMNVKTEVITHYVSFQLNRQHYDDKKNFPDEHNLHL